MAQRSRSLAKVSPSYAALPFALALHIFSHCSYTTVAMCSRVSKHWLIMARNNSLWLKLCVRQWPVLARHALFSTSHRMLSPLSCDLF